MVQGMLVGTCGAVCRWRRGVITDLMQEHIAGHRIRVQDVAVWHERQGMSVAEIVQQCPGLTPADVHAALAYYWDHRDAIERAIAEDDAFAERLHRAHPGPLERKRQHPQVG